MSHDDRGQVVDARPRRVLGALLVGFTALPSAAVAASAIPAPSVYVDYPNGSFYRACNSYTSDYPSKHVVHFCQGPSPLKVRPSAISLSVDGDGYLSDLDWSSWTVASAEASGLEEVRCFGGTTDPNCASDKFGYTVPVTVRLGTPVATSRGVVFTVLRALRIGHSPMVECLPPAAAC
jgi:hypothetical protein